MHWPQITMIVFVGIAIGVAMANHGEPKGDHNIWMTLLAVSIELFILNAGGFFG